MCENDIPIHYISGVSAGAMVAAAYAAGRSCDDIAKFGRTMKFRDVALWTISRMGLAGSERIAAFLERLLPVRNFEEMSIPLALVATGLGSGKPFVFRDRGEVISPIRASCSFPGLFQPMRYHDRYFIDGFAAMEVPALPLREMGATHVISVFLPNPAECLDPGNLFSIMNRTLQIMTRRLEPEWRRYSTVVISPDVADIEWNAFVSASRLIELGERAAQEALPAIRAWLKPAPSSSLITPATQRPAIAQ